ncbi:MAG: SDR family NAD(P)-dependent oxidoreductase [Proteobacteria bacterium]|nr:SDR family NAD(P)-dependent oxidoreductase [Pseudomonadota bacterium]MDA1134753.1 SDR family NAD(P)-dependent oxidoreductase [Pseudomonadota bacterium]
MHGIDKIKASLKGHTILITGGGSGIGYATAKLFAKMNANIAINYLPEDTESKNRVKELKEKYINIIEVPGDVSQEIIAKRIVFETIEKFKGLNFLINNVGIGLVKDPIAFDDLDQLNDNFWQKIMNVNLMSAFYCSRIASKELIKNKGTIVNVTSISSNGKRGTSIPYAVSKGALKTLTVSLAKSFAPNVRVNAVSPGFTESAMTNQRSEEHKKRMAKQTLLNRIAKPEEIAETIFFLCVSGSYITGETINVNGGHGFNY